MTKQAEIFYPDEFQPEAILKNDITMSVVSAEFAELGYGAEVELSIYPHAGRYVAEFRREDGTRGEVAWEPAYPQEQKLAVQWAFRNPAAAVRECLEVDISRRAAI